MVCDECANMSNEIKRCRYADELSDIYNHIIDLELLYQGLILSLPLLMHNRNEDE